MIKVSILGCGGASGTHVSRLSTLPEGEIQVVGFCDTIPERAENLRNYANRFRSLCPKPNGSDAVFTNYDSMLEKVGMDAIIICTPNALHFDNVMKALSKNLHVLVEKPMAVNSVEAEQMVLEAKSRNRILAVGYQRHCQPEYFHARQLLLQGSLGQPHFIVAWLVQNLFAAGKWYLDPQLSGGGQIKASGTHLIDSILWITNSEPVRVKALMDRRGEAVDIYSCLAIELSNGAIANISISGAAPTMTTAIYEEVRVWCSKGGLSILEGNLYVQNQEGDISRIDRGNLSQPSPNLDVNFIRSMQGKEECLCPGVWGLRATRLEEMAYKDIGSPIPSKLRGT